MSTLFSLILRSSITNIRIGAHNLFIYSLPPLSFPTYLSLRAYRALFQLLGRVQNKTISLHISLNIFDVMSVCNLMSEIYYSYLKIHVYNKQRRRNKNSCKELEKNICVYVTALSMLNTSY